MYYLHFSVIGIFYHIEFTIINLLRQVKFEDIGGQYAEKQIREVFEMGIMNGVDETHFEPDKPVTRAQAAIIARNVVRYITGK